MLACGKKHFSRSTGLLLIGQPLLFKERKQKVDEGQKFVGNALLAVPNRHDEQPD
jgi:hypothetical protein